MKKSKKILVFILIALGGIAAYIAYTKYNKAEDNIRDAEAISINAAGLMQEYATAEETANKKYIGKILSVTGKIKETAKNQEGQVTVTLNTDDPMNSIHCTMEGETANFTAGTTITLKGMCTGYMMDVYLTRCYIIK